MTYRIKDWDKHYENNKSRERDRCSYVCLPNRQDGIGLQRILGSENGAAIFGIWCLLLEKASRQSRPRQGWLTEDGKPDGRPWEVDDLALAWRQPVSLIVDAIAVLASARVDWIESIGNRAQKVGGHQAGTLPPPSARPEEESARPESQSARLETKSAQERKKEGKEGRKEEPSPSEKDLFDSRPSMPIPDRELIRPLAPYVRWKGSDPDGTEDNIAELIGLIHRYGAKEVLAAAIACWESAREKVWPNVVGERLMGEGEGDTTPEADDFTRQLPTVCQQAIDAVRSLGFQVVHAKCPQIDPTGDDARDLAHLIKIYEYGNQPAAKELLDAIGADA